MWVSGGFFDGQKLRFNDNITCLIGGTGSGKSLTLELLRYALDQQVDPAVLPKIASEIARLLRFALGDLDTVSVLVRKDGERYLIQRSWLPDDPPPPTVSRAVGGQIEVLDDPIHVPTFFPIKGFSQSEIIEYAREPLARLSLVDDLIDITEELAAIDRAKAALRQNASEILDWRAQLAKAQEQTKELPGLREEIERLSGFLTHPRVRQQDAWYAEQSILDRATDSLQALAADIDDGFPQLDTPFLSEGDLREKTPSKALMKKVADLEAEVRSALATSRQDLSATLERLRERLAEIRLAWDARFQKAERAYQRLLAKLEPAARSQAALQDRLAKRKRKEQRLQEADRRVTEVIEPRLAALNERRDQLLTELQKARKAIRAKREAKAKQLTDALGRQVLIKISAEGDHRAFREHLLSLRVGSRIQEGNIDKMARTLHPVPLVKSLLAQDFETPAGKSGLAPDLLQRFYENIVDGNRLPDLYELQLVDLEDVVEIRFAIEGDTYRDLEELAHGQKCTVVLMIALAEGDFPLLVDQPEDALHAPWIEDYIVTSLRRRRGNRQCLFATRSANVLVSADAEQIIALKADAHHGVVDRTGALDRFDTRDLVLYHVEGGKEAFRRRQEKYGLGPDRT